MKVNNNVVKNIIVSIGYRPEDGKNGIFYKSYLNHNDYTIRINFETEKIEYRSKNISEEDGIKLGDATTSNFENSENFVVLECVDRLLEKGYPPKSISLEHKFPLGRELKGKLDILVFDNENKAFLMIECKTWGTEYEKERKKMIKDGGQLFSYYVQEKDVKYLCLYTSHVNNDQMEYRNEIIKVDKIWIELSNKKEIHDHWNKNFKDNGIFDEWVNPYDIKIKALIRGRLKELTQEDSGCIFNQFAEILRHNVISDKPNAFNKILNLFICKIIDEDRNEFDQVEFQWLENDTDESLQSRLNDLYKKGMHRFLGIDVTDYSEDDIANKLTNIEDKRVLEEIESMFSKLRLQKNPEFAFMEVYDETSFKANSRVVREVVELLQPYQFRYGHKQQFLGNFFELLLNTSMKQEVGQFFTPVPITHFIVSSLPIKEFILKKLKSDDTEILPVVIDYATGSGHFLTEYMDQVQNIIQNIDINKAIPSARKKINVWRGEDAKFDWAKDYVYGIEADYRLVKTTKVSSFLNGDGEANIFRANGLDNFAKSKDFKLKLKSVSKDDPKDNGQFDILIANPPYSVSAFKATVKYGEESFELFDKLTNNSSEIECLFVERAKQLLKVGGWAGIILPNSILTNAGIYTATREIILKYFYIKAITEFGSNTFMATGTNTVTLFLERRPNNDYKIISNAINSFFDRPKESTVLGIEKAFSKYINEVFDDISFDDYLSFVLKKPNDKFKKLEIYKDYKDWFEGLTEVKQMKEKKTFKDLSIDEKQLEIEKLFFVKIFEIEKDKMLYFMLTYPQNTVIIKVGEKQNEKDFIGYEFSNRRGHEGIKMLPSGTKLYDENDLLNPDKANSYVYKAFLNEDIKIAESMKRNIFVANTTELMNFNKVAFEKSISITSKKKVQLETSTKLIKLGDIAEVIAGQSPKGKYYNTDKIGTPFYQGKTEFTEKYLSPAVKWTTQVTKIAEENDIVMSVRAPVGPVNLVRERICIGRGLAAIRTKGDFLYQYLFVVLKEMQDNIIGNTGTVFNSISKNDIEQIKVPFLPIDIQTQIVNKIEYVELQERNAKSKIKDLKNKIEALIEQLIDKSKQITMLKKVAIINPPKPNINDIDANTNISFIEMASLSEEGYVQKQVLRPLSSVIGGGYTAFKDRDIIIAKITPCMENGKCAIADGLENGIGFGSTEFHVIRVNEDVALTKYIFLLLNRVQVREKAKLQMTGRSGHRRVPANFYEDFEIPDINLMEQKKFIREIETIKEQIASIEAKVANTENERKEILREYLQ